MNLFRLFEQLENSAVGSAIRESIWLFPAIEAVHLLGLALLGGAVLILDLRLLGFGLTNAPISQLERQTRPWLVAALLTMLITGVPLFLSESLKLYDNQAFWIKLAALACALLATLTIRIHIALRLDISRINTGLRHRALATISLSLWLIVIIAGRWIGFS